MIFYWHIHHELLMEPLTESVTMRREYIKRYKPASQRATRLRLLKRVKNQAAIPENILRQAERFVEGWSTDYTLSVMLNNSVEIQELHKLECPKCPWDGRTIFPEKEVEYNNV